MPMTQPFPAELSLATSISLGTFEAVRLKTAIADFKNAVLALKALDTHGLKHIPWAAIAPNRASVIKGYGTVR